MNISINVPSYGRAQGCDTFDLFPEAVFWVHAFEVEEYLKNNPSMRVKKLPDDLRGNIARVRNFILDNTRDDDVSIQMDDDIKSIILFENQQRIVLSVQEIMEYIYKYSSLALEWEVRLWGVNNSPDQQSYREYSPFSTQSYISASFSCFMKGNELRYDERFSLKEDYDMMLQQLNTYRKTLRVNKLVYVKRSITNVGGCSNYRTHSKEVEQIELLRKKWGTKIVKYDRNMQNHLTKKNKTLLDINPRILSPIAGI